MSDKTTYTRVPNYLIDNDEMSIESLVILLLYLRHKPDFNFDITYLRKRIKRGRDTVYRYLKELRELGYLNFEVERNNGPYSGLKKTVDLPGVKG